MTERGFGAIEQRAYARGRWGALGFGGLVVLWASSCGSLDERPRTRLTTVGSDGYGDSGGSIDDSNRLRTGDITSFGPVDSGRGPARSPTDPNLLVAFIGDQGNNDNSSAVLELIAREGAQAVVHNGDFDYEDNPAAWEDRINGVLGPNFPYFAVLGNHDAAAWGGPEGYGARIAARHARVPDMVCTGEIGVQANCRFRGLHLIESCVGTDELRPSCAADSVEQIDFIRASLANTNDIFSVCNWHKNQHDMQVGRKGDAVGWKAYQACMNGGAIIATGHEHSYSRTLTLTDVGNVGTGHGAVGGFDFVELDTGKTFAFVSGIAGRGIRDFDTADHDDDTWWASAYASNRWLKNGVQLSGVAAYGALFIEFHLDGNPTRARAYFKDINGRIADEFTIQAH